MNVFVSVVSFLLLLLLLWATVELGSLKNIYKKWNDSKVLDMK